MKQYVVGDRVYSQNPQRDHMDHNTFYRVHRIIGMGGDENEMEGWKDADLLAGKYYQAGDYVLVDEKNAAKRHGEKGMYIIPAPSGALLR